MWRRFRFTEILSDGLWKALIKKNEEVIEGRVCIVKCGKKPFEEGGVTVCF